MIALVCVFGALAVPEHTSTRAATVRQSTVDPRFGLVEAWRAPQEATDLGVGWERLTLWWKALQPDGPNSWNAFATGRDHFITKELAAGRHLVGEVVNTPDWAAVNPSQHGSSVPKGLYLPYNDPNNYWGHFVALIAKRYAGRIDEWILWNEVNIPSGKYATWKGTVADYAQLVKVAYQAAHEVNPNAKIILFGDPYWYDYGAFFDKLLSRLTQDPGAASTGAYFDVANLHLYSRPRDYLPIIALYRKMLSQHGLSKPIWIGETNAIPYNDPVRQYPRSNYFASLDDQASYIVEVFSVAVALDVQRIEVNRMIDGTDFIAGGEPFGLLRNDKSRRPAYYAYRLATSLYAGSTGGTVTVNASTGVYMSTLQKPGQTITVAWSQKPSSVAISIPALAQTALVFDKLGQSHSVVVQNGHFNFVLAPSTGNTDPHDPHDYVMGGNPLILVQAHA